MSQGDEHPIRRTASEWFAITKSQIAAIDINEDCENRLSACPACSHRSGDGVTYTLHYPTWIILPRSKRYWLSPCCLFSSSLSPRHYPTLSDLRSSWSSLSLSHPSSTALASAAVTPDLPF